MRITVGILVLLSVCAVGLRVMAQQEMRPTPGPGSGRMTVDVATIPIVQVAPAGEWRTTVANVPDVRVVNTPSVVSAAPDFVRSGGRYEITWSGGDRETVTVSEAMRGGWIRVEEGNRRRWLNVGAARSLEELSR
jgi:hypothetical protein